MTSELARFHRAMADHLAELARAQHRRRSVPIAAQLGVIGVAGGVSMVWLGEHVAMGQAAGALAAVSGMILYLTAMLIGPDRRLQMCSQEV